VVLKFIKECFDGVLVSDFWYAYNVLICAKQKCLVHLLRQLERVLKYKDSGGDRAGCSKKLKRLIRDAIRLRKRRDKLFTFLRNADVPFDNNFGERSIRGAVIMRKSSFNSRSQKGAMTQSVLMSVFFTIKQHGFAE